MIQLISRSGTLFSIIDGREIVCKDQEQAKLICLKARDSENGVFIPRASSQIPEGVIYSVPGYNATRILQKRWGTEWHDLPNQDVGREPEGIYQTVALLSLEAPEPKITMEDGEMTFSVEQPAHPVDKQSIKERFDSLIRQSVKVSTYVSCDTEKEVHEICMECITKLVKENQVVSPSPERGESDERERLKKYLIEFMDERIALCDNISDNTPE